jgi:hypothetical protein
VVGRTSERLGEHPDCSRRSRRGHLRGGDLWVVEEPLDYGEGAEFSTVLIFEFRDDRIARETAYWATPGPPAEWRAEWVEPLESSPTGA